MFPMRSADAMNILSEHFQMRRSNICTHGFQSQCHIWNSINLSRPTICTYTHFSRFIISFFRCTLAHSCIHSMLEASNYDSLRSNSALRSNIKLIRKLLHLRLSFPEPENCVSKIIDFNGNGKRQYPSSNRFPSLPFTVYFGAVLYKHLGLIYTSSLYIHIFRFNIIAYDTLRTVKQQKLSVRKRPTMSYSNIDKSKFPSRSTLHWKEEL